MTRWRSILRRARAIGWTALAVGLILAAMVVGIANLLLPYADRYRPELESWLAQRLSRDVAIERIDARWAAFGPQMEIRGLRIGAAGDTDTLKIDLADVRIDLLSWLKYGSHGFGAFRLLVPELTISRTAEGRWRVAGFGSSTKPLSAEAMWQLLDSQAMIGLNLERLRVLDPAIDLDLELPGGNLHFNNLGDEQHAEVRLGSDASGFIDLLITARPAERRVELYASSAGIALAELDPMARNAVAIDSGTLMFETWGDMTADHQTFQGKFTVQGIQLHTREGSEVVADYELVHARSDYRFALAPGGRRELALANVSVTRGGDVWTSENLSAHVDNDGWNAQGGQLRLRDVVDALVLSPALPTPWRRRLRDLDIRGDVRGFNLVGRGLDVSGGLEAAGLGWSAAGALPGARGVDLSFAFGGAQASGRVSGRAMELDLTPHMRAPLTAIDLTAAVNVDWSTTPSVTFEELSYVAPGLRLRGRGGLQFNGGRPFVDLGIEVGHGEIARSRDYWVVTRMPPRAVSWLDEHANNGVVEHGSLVLFGDLDAWPFRAGEGTFKASAAIANVRLDYLPGWPGAQQISANLDFTPVGMSATIDSAVISGAQVTGAHFELPRFKDPIIDMELTARGANSDLLDFVRASPLHDRIERYAADIEITGASDVDVKLSLPLRPDLGERRVSGHVELNEADVHDDAWDLDFLDTSGVIAFDQDGLTAERLATRFRGTPAQLTLHAGEDAIGAEVEGILEGRSHPEVLTLFAETTPRLSEAVGGQMSWRARLAVPSTASRIPTFTLNGDLTDLSLDLPAPFAKTSGEPLALEIGFEMAPHQRRVHGAIGERIRIVADRDSDSAPWRAAIRFGAGAPPEADQVGVVVDGQVHHVDGDGWLELLRDLPLEVAGTEQPPRLNLEIDSLRLAGRQFDTLTIQSQTVGDHWHIEIGGPRLQGRLRLPTAIDENRLLLAEFDRFDWPEALAQRPAAEIEPAAYPPLDFYASHLIFEGIDLGEVRIESHPTATGMRIDTFTTQSEDLRLNASGDWESAELSRFELTATSADLGAALERFGFSEVISGGQLVAQLVAEWPGAPSEFELASLDGELDLSVVRGQIVEADPGAGRVFGLLSVSALPRRLLLDFSDLFRSGLTFDQITGHFALEGGRATTEDLEIHSPTADLFILGTTNLSEQQYHQTVTVIPKVGESLPWVGAIAGGGVGAAAVFVLQRVFRDQIDRITQYHYSVEGPWTDPEVELLGADQMPPPTATTTPTES